MKRRAPTYMPEVLDPRADSEVAQAAQRRADLDSLVVIDPIAEILYKLHRGGYGTGRSKVKERTWSTLPKSEQGKYRRIVRDAVARFRDTQP